MILEQWSTQRLDSWSKPAWTVHVNLVLQTAAIAWCDGSLQWLRASENKGPIKNATIIHYPNLTHQTCPNVRHPAALFHHWPLCTLLPSSQPQSVGGGGATFARHLTFLILIRSGVIRATGLTMFNDIGNAYIDDLNLVSLWSSVLSELCGSSQNTMDCALIQRKVYIFWSGKMDANHIRRPKPMWLNGMFDLHAEPRLGHTKTMPTSRAGVANQLHKAASWNKGTVAAALHLSTSVEMATEQDQDIGHKTANTANK